MLAQKRRERRRPIGQMWPPSLQGRRQALEIAVPTAYQRNGSRRCRGAVEAARGIPRRLEDAPPPGAGNQHGRIANQPGLDPVDPSKRRSGLLGVSARSEMDQRGATVRDDEIPQAVCVGHQVDGRGSIARLHVVVGNDDHYGFRPSILHRIEELTNGAVRGGVTRLSGAALWSVVMPDRVGLIEMPEHQLDRRVAERLQQVRHYLHDLGIAVRIEGVYLWYDDVRGPV